MGEKYFKTDHLYTEFKDHDRFRFPDPIVRVTAGMGGETLLIFGKEKTVLYDTGMAYGHEGMIRNVERALAEHGRKQPDLLLVSHTHYDHIGAMPYILRRWPGITVTGSAKAVQVFKSEGARRTMKRLGEAARDNFTDSREELITEPMRIDHVVGDGDKISIGGGEYFDVLVTKGHTDCALTYVLQPQSIMFANESTGMLRGPGSMSVAVLKSYQDSVDSAVKCRNYHPAHIISPHYGMVPDEAVDGYFDLFLQTLQVMKDYILKYYDQGMNKDELMKKVEEYFWFEGREKAQPKAAFTENIKIEIPLIVRTFRGTEL